MNTVSPGPSVQDLPKLPPDQKWHFNYNHPADNVAVPSTLTIGENVTLMIDIRTPSWNKAKPIEFGAGVTLGNGVRVDSGATIEPGLTIGHRAWIKADAYLTASCEIDEGAWVGTGTRIGALAVIGKKAVIGDGVIIGEGVIVQPGVHIPNNWYIPGSTTCAVVVNSGRTDKDPPVVLPIPL